MKGFDIWNATANAQIAFALVLIAVFMGILVFRKSSR